MASTKLMLIYS